MSLNSYFRVRVWAGLGVIGCLLSAFAGVTAAVSMDSWANGEHQLEGGMIYTVSADKTLSAAGAEETPLNVYGTPGNPAILYIPSGITLTVKGANGGQPTWATPGIGVDSGSGLVICGGGQLIVSGG